MYTLMMTAHVNLGCAESSSDDEFASEDARGPSEASAGLQYAMGLSEAAMDQRARGIVVSVSQGASESEIANAAKKLRCLRRGLRKLSAKVDQLAAKL